ncbi:MAG: hypothetical protein KTR32_34085, partial [Granulosicoccus sp.]|nr:hypothetical protein [Granulosicoccus sp.]
FLVAAALLGFVIGWFFNRIQAIGTYNQLAEESESRLRILKKQLLSASEDRTNLQDALQATRVKLSNLESSQKSMDDYVARLADKQQRIEELEAQAYASEEQHMRVQRDFAKFRLYKTKEVQQLQQQLAARGGAVPNTTDPATNEVPTLQKKAGAAAAVVGSVEGAAARLPDITHEVLESNQDVMDMTSEFNFDPEELLSND